MIRLLSSRLVCHRDLYKGQGKVMSYLSTFLPTRDPLIFQKIPCHPVALLKDNVIFNISFQIGTILLSEPFTYQILICMYNYPRNSSLFGIKIEQHSLLKTSKTLRIIHIAHCNISSMLAHIPQILHHMHWPSFILGSKHNINNLPSLTILKICLGQQFLTCCDFCEGLAPILFITSLSKDKVPSVEKPYVDFNFYRYVNKLSPIESIKTKQCLLLGTKYFGNTRPLQHLFHFRFSHCSAPRNWSIFKSYFYQLESFDQIGASSIWKWCVLISQCLSLINCI